jgi:hypothetical protein
MLSIFSWLLSFLPSAFNAITAVTNAIADEKIAAINATTQQEAIASQERVVALQAQRDVLIADATHSQIDMWIRSAIALGPTGYLLKIFLYDKVFGYWTNGRTDVLSPELWQAVMVVLGFYFLYTGAMGVAKVFKA